MCGVRTFYHYSDSGLVAEMDSNGNTLKSYGYRPGSPWGTDLLFMRENPLHGGDEPARGAAVGIHDDIAPLVGL